MKAILNNKLYDTDKAEFILAIKIPQNDFCDTAYEFNIFKTAKGNIFAEHKSAGCLIDESILKTILSRQDCIDIYIKIFGKVEEA